MVNVRPRSTTKAFTLLHFQSNPVILSSMKTNPVLTPVQQRLVAKLQTKGLKPVADTDLAIVRVNPYSRVGVELCPLAASLVDWIVSPDRGGEIHAGQLARGDWDRARYLFLALWPEPYYQLLD